MPSSRPLGTFGSGVTLRRPLAVIVLGAGLCAWCGWVSGFHQSTVAAFATWSASLAVILGIDLLWWQGRSGRRPGLPPGRPADPWPPAHRNRPGLVLSGLTPWLILVLVVLAWEVLGIDTGAHVPHLTISALAQTYRALNAALLLAWMLVGLGYGWARARTPTSEHPRVVAGRASHVPVVAGSAVGGHPMMAPALLLPGSRTVGLGFWLGVLVVAVLVEVAARRSHRRVATAGELVRCVSRPMLVNVALIVGWVYGGWHFFAH